MLVRDLGRVGSAIPEDWLLSSLQYEYRVNPYHSIGCGGRYLTLDEWHSPYGCTSTATGTSLSESEGTGGSIQDGADIGAKDDRSLAHHNPATKAAIKVAEIHADGYDLSLSCLLRVGLFAAFAASFTGFKVRLSDNLVLPGALPISSLAGYGPRTVSAGQTYPADMGGPITSIGDLRRVYADSYADSYDAATTPAKLKELKAFVRAALGKDQLAASAVAQMVAPEPADAYAYDPSD